MSEIMKQAEAYRKKIEAASQYAPDEIAFDEPTLIVLWTPEWLGKRDDRVRDEGGFYRSLHDITNSAQNTKPSETPSMWAKIPDPAEEWPEWVQPGGHNAYELGAKVSHLGCRYVSQIPANTTKPGTDERWWQKQ